MTDKQIYLKEPMDLLPNTLDLVVALVESVFSVREVEECVVLFLLPCEERGLAPRGHEFLQLLHVVLGLLDAGLQINHLVSGALDVLPDAWS